jgi:hypothetical protein
MVILEIHQQQKTVSNLRMKETEVVMCSLISPTKTWRSPAKMGWVPNGYLMGTYRKMAMGPDWVVTPNDYHWSLHHLKCWGVI